MEQLTLCSVVYGRMEKFWKEFCLPSLQDDINILKPKIKVYQTHQDFLLDAPNLGLIFYTSPDHIWAKDSLLNMFEQIKNLDIAIAVPHFRVNEESITSVLSSCMFPFKTEDLVSFMLAHAHQNFISANDTEHVNCCQMGLIQRDLWTVTTIRHSLPTIFMLHFNASDAEFFKRHNYCWGEWDRGFLAKVYTEGRLKIAGSSDFAFTVELTEEKSHFCPTQENNFKETYHKEQAYNAICRTTLYTIRSL